MAKPHIKIDSFYDIKIRAHQIHAYFKHEGTQWNAPSRPITPEIYSDIEQRFYIIKTLINALTCRFEKEYLS